MKETLTPTESKKGEEKQPQCLLNTLDLATGDSSTQKLTRVEIQELALGQKPDILSQTDLKNLVTIESESFGFLDEEWLLDEESYQEELSQLQGPQFLIRENGRLVGFIHTKPANLAYQNFQEVGLLKQNPDFQSDPQALYIETIAGKFSRIGRKAFKMFQEQAQELGFRKLICHGINPRLNKILIRLGFENKRKISNWLNHQAFVLEKKLRSKND